MKATLLKPASAINASAHRREKYFSGEIAAIDRATGAALVSLRLYGSPSNACNYACLWVHAEPVYATGSARASGYGYHRTSQAAQEAINKAGFTLSQDIAGVGEQAMQEAVKAIAICVGCADPIIHVSHG
jgi:hypothetical protein